MNEQLMAKENLIYKIRSGSIMYGTYTGASDDDFGGIFIPDKDYVIGTKRCDQVELSEKRSKTIRNQKGDIDCVFYSLPKFIQLAKANNPNILEYFFAPVPCIIKISTVAQTLINNRHLFISKKAYHTFKEYAYAQRQKLLVKKENMTGRTELAEKFGYDTKFASHLIRLYIECIQLLTEKTIVFPLAQNNVIRDIKLGKWTLDAVMKEAERLEQLIDEAYIRSDLQYKANEEEINKLQITLLEYFWRNQ